MNQQEPRQANYQDNNAENVEISRPDIDTGEKQAETQLNAAQSTTADEAVAATAAETAATDKTTAATEATAATAKPRRKVTKALVIEYVMRVVVLCIGLFIMSIGVNLSVQADLGTSPISSIPAVLAEVFNMDDIGVTTIVVNVVISLIQIPILRRRYNPIQLLQIPVSSLFGVLCSATNTFLKDITPTAYWDNWLICIAGIVLVAIGVSIEVATNVTTLAGEGLALSLNKVFPKIKFGYMKVICDCSLVIIAVIISFACMHVLRGVREGTLAAAIFVGLIAKQLNKFVIPLANKFFALPHRKEIKAGGQQAN